MHGEQHRRGAAGRSEQPGAEVSAEYGVRRRWSWQRKAEGQGSQAGGGGREAGKEKPKDCTQGAADDATRARRAAHREQAAQTLLNAPGMPCKKFYDSRGMHAMILSQPPLCHTWGRINWKRRL